MILSIRHAHGGLVIHTPKASDHAGFVPIGTEGSSDTSGPAPDVDLGTYRIEGQTTVHTSEHLDISGGVVVSVLPSGVTSFTDTRVSLTVDGSVLCFIYVSNGTVTKSLFTRLISTTETLGGWQCPSLGSIARGTWDDVVEMCGDGAGEDFESRRLYDELTHTNLTNDVVVPNTKLWCNKYREQLNGIPWAIQFWAQSYGLVPITRRHVVSCAHGGPSGLQNLWIKYAKSDGTIFQTNIAAWINDLPAAANAVSDTQMEIGEGGYTGQDISVYLLSDELPDWVTVYPILDIRDMMSFPGYPDNNQLVLVPSQGNLEEYTPENRMVFPQAWGGLTIPPEVSSYHYTPSSGDSGHPRLLAVEGTLYLVDIVSGHEPGQCIDYLNNLIVRADVSAGISTGYTVENTNLQLS